MLAVAGELADGTITYWADQRAVAEHVVVAVGDEKSAAAQLRAYEDAGATDFCAAVVALGADRIANRRRTLDFLSSGVK